MGCFHTPERAKEIRVLLKKTKEETISESEAKRLKELLEEDRNEREAKKMIKRGCYSGAFNNRNHRVNSMTSLVRKR